MDDINESVGIRSQVESLFSQSDDRCKTWKIMVMDETLFWSHVDLNAPSDIRKKFFEKGKTGHMHVYMLSHPRIPETPFGYRRIFTHMAKASTGLHIDLLPRYVDEMFFEGIADGQLCQFKDIFFMIPFPNKHNQYLDVEEAYSCVCTLTFNVFRVCHNVKTLSYDFWPYPCSVTESVLHELIKTWCFALGWETVITLEVSNLNGIPEPTNFTRGFTGFESCTTCFV